MSKITNDGLTAFYITAVPKWQQRASKG